MIPAFWRHVWLRTDGYNSAFTGILTRIAPLRVAIHSYLGGGPGDYYVPNLVVRVGFEPTCNQLPFRPLIRRRGYRTLIQWSLEFPLLRFLGTLVFNWSPHMVTIHGLFLFREALIHLSYRGLVPQVRFELTLKGF